MAVSLQKFRELVFQLLYSRDFETDWKAVQAFAMGQLVISKKTLKEVLEKVEEIWQKLPDIDLLISETSKTYELHRIPKVERTILRLAIFELRYSNIPPKVAIAEAVRLTRKFATVEATAFVNAVLDALYQEA